MSASVSNNSAMHNNTDQGLKSVETRWSVLSGSHDSIQGELNISEEDIISESFCEPSNPFGSQCGYFSTPGKNLPLSGFGGFDRGIGRTGFDSVIVESSDDESSTQIDGVVEDSVCDSSVEIVSPKKVTIEITSSEDEDETEVKVKAHESSTPDQSFPRVTPEENHDPGNCISGDADETQIPPSFNASLSSPSKDVHCSLEDSFAFVTPKKRNVPRILSSDDEDETQIPSPSSAQAHDPEDSVLDDSIALATPKKRILHRILSSDDEDENDMPPLTIDDKELSHSFSEALKISKSPNSSNYVQNDDKSSLCQPEDMDDGNKENVNESSFGSWVGVDELLSSNLNKSSKDDSKNNMETCASSYNSPPENTTVTSPFVTPEKEPASDWKTDEGPLNFSFLSNVTVRKKRFRSTIHYSDAESPGGYVNSPQLKTGFQDDSPLRKLSSGRNSFNEEPTKNDHGLQEIECSPFDDDRPKQLSSSAHNEETPKRTMSLPEQENITSLDDLKLLPDNNDVIEVINLDLEDKPVDDNSVYVACSDEENETTFENEYLSPGPRRLSSLPSSSLDESIDWPVGKDPANFRQLSFISSLWGHPEVPGFVLHPDAVKYVENFKKHREELADILFTLYNDNAFAQKLPRSMPVEWSNRLSKTAGYTKNSYDRDRQRNSSITLSGKILVKPCQLAITLAHEMCHSAAWLLNGQRGHGKAWKYWTLRARDAYPELPPITVCHKYDTVGSYIYQCLLCEHKMGSNKPWNLELYRCNSCPLRGKLKCIQEKANVD